MELVAHTAPNKWLVAETKNWISMDFTGSWIEIEPEIAMESDGCK